jgi:hypothetical protein
MEAAGADRSAAAASVRWCLPVVGLAIVLVLSAIAAQAGPGSQSGQLGSARAAPGWQALPASFGPQSGSLPAKRASLSELRAVARRRAANAYATLPLAFVPNSGQADQAVRYYAHGAGSGFYFSDEEAVLAFQNDDRGEALHLWFVGANPEAELTATDRGTGRVNWLTGSEPHTNLPTYSRLVYRDLWPGIDMVLGGGGGELNYEFRLRPGAEVSDIRLAYAGAEKLSLSRSGSLLIDASLGTLRDPRPRGFQPVDGRRVPVDSRYVLAGDSYGFAVEVHDGSQPLVIEQSLSYSTYLGGSNEDFGEAIAVDSAGSVYIAGATASTDLPTTAGAFDNTFNGFSGDAFVTKLDPTGSSLGYSTYLGGSSGEVARGIAVDSEGAAYVTGPTGSTDFPTTSGAFDTLGGGDLFVTKLDPTGSSLAYSTYLGGTGDDFGGDIAIDPAGAAYVTGATLSTNFPTTPGAFDTTLNSLSGDAFVTKLDPSGSNLTYSTYLGGSAAFGAAGFGIAVDSAGAAYVSGRTTSSDFPTIAGAFDPTFNGGDADTFVAKLDRAGSSLDYSTFLGGSSDEVAQDIAVDSVGAAYVTGPTTSADFPTSAGAFDMSFNGPEDAFVTKLDPSGSSLAYSTYLGGTNGARGEAIAVDPAGAAYVTGDTSSTDFPTTAGAFETTFNGLIDAFVTKVDPAGSSLASSTYLGGSSVEQGFAIALDSTGAAYVTGRTTSSDFPTTAGAFDASFSGPEDGFVTKFASPRPAPCSITQAGWITASNGDRATFGGNAHSDAAGNVEGQQRYRDHGPAQPQEVKSIRILAVTCNQERTNATILGEATIDASGTHAFSIDVQDLGEPGRGLDTYRILLDTGYDSGVRTLQGGNVQIYNG